jgi:hypothetical protein
MAMTIALFKSFISQFRILTLRHSCGDVIFMICVPVSEALKWSLVSLALIISAILILAFHDSCDEESRHLTLPTPSTRSSEMESNQWSTPSMIRRLFSAPRLHPSGLWVSDSDKTPEEKTLRVSLVLRHSMTCHDSSGYHVSLRIVNSSGLKCQINLTLVIF